MHPKESKRQSTGTGKLANLSLKDSEIFIGKEFSNHHELQELLNDSNYFPVLMYPGKNVWTANKEGFDKIIGNKRLLVIIVDATWRFSKTLINHNRFLLDLPRVSFTGNYQSIYTFKREPRPECISTIESCYFFIKEMQSVGLENEKLNPEPLMNVFKAMIKFQLQAENERILGIRPTAHTNHTHPEVLRVIPDF
ncbi:DTW-domain-containing protein [Neocallimastix sp. 'constans']